MRSGNTTPPCAIEDWSGAGFHTKQPLNVGQPTVSQVVSSPNNQSCLDPSLQPLDSAQPHGDGSVCVLWEVPATTSRVRGPPSQSTRTLSLKSLWGDLSGPKEQWAGMANRQVRARFYCHGLEVFFGGGDTSKTAPPGFEPVNPLWSSRFLLMQTHVGYRSA